MFLKVNPSDYKVDFYCKNIQGERRLKEEVVVEVVVQPGVGVILYFYHPDREGHFDLMAISSVEKGYLLQKYDYQSEVWFWKNEEIGDVWPTGAWSFFRTLMVVDEYLRHKIGLNSTFQNVVLRKFSM